MTTAEALTVASLVTAATEGTGLADLGEDSWREGLDRLLDSVRSEADLNDVGVEVVAASVRDHLKSRLWVTDWHRRHPEIGSAAVPAPVVILGQPRTGTTILFDLLAQDPRFRVPLTWEVAQPHPPPETATYDTDPRIEAAAAGGAMTEALVPGFQAIHPSGPLRGQECVTITAGDFRSLLFSTVFHVPSYTRWLLWEADMASAYRYHRRFLQLLQWRHPGERWLLKTPGHQWCLDALFTEYPDATIVHTHRDPLKVLASTASLTAHLQRLASDHTSIPVQAAEWVDYLAAGNDRSVDGREDGTVPPGRAVDIHFGRLMADPFGTISALYEQLGLHLTPDVEGRMRTFLADNPADKHGVHTYSFAATGLDEDAVRARTLRYEKYFRVPREVLD
ncbi:MAG: sulfotransferase family protein [Acidimicrobiales bacterium]